MIQYKRQPVRLLKPPPNLDDNSQVWTIEETGEVFVDYESFLERLEFYQQKHFSINGTSGLTYFDALEAKHQGVHSTQLVFPEQLCEPVLRWAQFSQISSFKDLADEAYRQFRHDFFPGEHVIGITPDEERLKGIVREKVSFPPSYNKDGSVARPTMSTYFVQVSGSDALGNHVESTPIFDHEHLTRDKKLFSRDLLRSFLYNTLMMDPNQATCWLVKPHFAVQYNIKTELPLDLQPRLLAESRQILDMATRKKRKTKTPITLNGDKQVWEAGKMPRPRPPPLTGDKSRDLKNKRKYEDSLKQWNDALASGTLNGSDHAMDWTQGKDPEAEPEPEPSPKVPVPTIKNPVEDLDIPPRQNGMVRPSLHFFAGSLPRSHTQATKESSENLLRAERVLMSSVGPLLEIWNTLTVQEEVFVLQPFTLDDFFDSLLFPSQEIECQLCVEVHCAVLKQLASADGVFLIDLPELEESSSEDSEDVSEPENPEESEDEAPPARFTRGSLRRSEAERLKLEATPPPDPSQPTHRADELFAEYSCLDRLKTRDFSHGGWQVAVAGILRQLSLNEKQRERCERILRELCPMETAPTPEDVRINYGRMSIDLKIQALQILCSLAITTKAMRDYLVDQSETMTEIRKDKLEQHKSKKQYAEELRELDEERRALEAVEGPKDLPDGEALSQAADNASVDPGIATMRDEKFRDDSTQGSVRLDTAEDVDDNTSSDDDEAEDEERHTRRSLRGGQDRKRKREEENARREEEKRSRAEAKAAASVQPKVSAKMRKLVRDIEKLKDKIKACEDELLQADVKLRETNCQRTKLLGKDRFSNRYYWFERNGIVHERDGETGYANGRIWVQGPDDMERQGYLELDEEEMRNYAATFGMDIPERRKLEEGETRLSDAHEWGYIDTSQDLDTLIGWLDDRGKREKELRKELTIWKDAIAKCMDNLQKHLQEKTEKAMTQEAEAATRVSTRNRTYVEVDESRWECLKWENTLALSQLGHLHSEQPRPRAKKASRNSGVKETAKIPLGKGGKPLTRQGAR